MGWGKGATCRRDPLWRVTLTNKAASDVVLTAHVIVVCIGKRPILPALPAQCYQSNGELLVDELGRTPCPGLYVGGDARRGIYRQVAIASGDGVAAAMDAVRFFR
jgi:thioredoxin reductase